MRRGVLAVCLVLFGLSVPAFAAPHGVLKQTRGKKTRFELQGAVLARPTDGQTDPANTHKWNGPEAGGSPVCTAQFCVHWTDSGIDASTEAYARDLANILQNEVYPCENGTGVTACGGSPGLGWRDPEPDFGLGGGDQTDVYIEDLYDTEHVYGYTAVDPGQTRDPTIPHYAYMVLDKDYSRYGTLSGSDAERITAAHEYNHVLQNAYDYLEDAWMFESTAVYMEKKVYPGISDYVRYVGAWTRHLDEPLTSFSDDLKPYGSAVWNHWLDHRFGSAVIRDAWAQSPSVADFAPFAYATAISDAGGADFSDEFDRFAAAIPEWEAPGSGFPDRYPDVPRAGPLPVESQVGPFNLAHTTFALYDVPVPGNAPRAVRLTASLPAGTAGAVALVGRTGADPTAGSVTTKLTPMPSGGSGAAELENPAQYGRITAVVVDSDPARALGPAGGYTFDPVTDDWIFAHDATGVLAVMQQPGAPIATTGSASHVRDHSALVASSIDAHLNDTQWWIEYGRTSRYGRRTGVKTLPAKTVGTPILSSNLTDLDARAHYHYRVVARNAAGLVKGADSTFGTHRDVTAPKLVLSVSRAHAGRVWRAGFTFRARASERCRGLVTISLSPAVARRAALPAVIVKTSLRIRAAGVEQVFHVRLTKAARRLWRDGGSRSFSALMRVRVHDAASHDRIVRRRVPVFPH